MSQYMPVLISLIMAVIPSCVLVWFYCRQNSDQTGSKAFIIKIFLIGILSIVPIVTLEMIIGKLNVYFNWSLLLYHFFEAFVVAGLCEEYIKLAIVKVFVFRNENFKKIIDGIIYTIIAGLGFACIENIIYVMNSDWETAIVRGLTAVPLHAVCSGILGYYIGEAKFAQTEQQEKQIINTGLWQAILVHGAYDFLIMISPLYGSIFTALIIPLVIWNYFKLKEKIYIAIIKDGRE